MAFGFNLLVIGLIFVFLDIEVGRFDLLPDFVGFLLLALGANILYPFAAAFRPARNVAGPLVLLTFLELVSPPILLQVLLPVNLILTVLAVWFLMGGALQFATERDRPDLAWHAGTYRRVYVGIGVFMLLFLLFGYIEPEAAGAFVTFFSFLSWVLLAFILRLFYILKREFAVEFPTVP